MPSEPPETLSPSKIDRFTTCPLSFRYSYIDKIPEPSTLAQVKGTITHKVLELLYQNEPEKRTSEKSLEILGTLWNSEETSGSVEEVTADAKEKLTLAKDIEKLLLSYFEIEDPVKVNCKAAELDITTEISGHKIRGIIDRLDILEGGELSIADYKTGQAPGEFFEKAKLNGVLFYALLCEIVFGQRPVETKLIYLKDKVSIIKIPSEQSIHATKIKIIAVSDAIARACDRDDFRPKPSKLCSYCSYKPICPVFADDKTADALTT